MKKTILFFLVIGLTGLAIWIITEYFGKKNNPVSMIETRKQIQYGFLVRNKTNALINDGKLWIYAPVEKAGAQSLVDIVVNTPFQKIKSESGNQILCFDIKDLPPYGAMQIQIQANLIYRSIHTPNTNSKNHSQYLKPQKFVESDHPDIIALAQTLKESNAFVTARNIFNWVSSNIEYSGYIKNNRGALYALQHKKGDCTEFMSLYLALCRAALIPARGVGGYTCIGSCNLVPVSYHNWAQVYVDGSWRLVDCQKKVFNQNDQDYIAMQIINPDKKDVMKGFRQFSFKGNGFDVVMAL